MSTSQRGKVMVETGRVLVDFVKMTDSGDQAVFNSGAVMSGKSGFEPDVRPNGIVTGSNLISPGAAADEVAVAAFTCYIGGAEISVDADAAVSVTRPAADGRITSIVVDDLGAISEVAGTDGTATESRGVAGGPPLIPVDEVEIGQVRMTSTGAAVFTAAEIFQDVGTHAETYDYPSFEIDNIGEGRLAAISAKKNAFVEFAAALPSIHVGTLPKEVYVKYYAPTLATLSKTVDFVASETGVTKSSEIYYEGAGGSGAIGSMKADSVGDVSFTVFANDGITDAILNEKNQMVTVKFYPDSNKLPYLLSQGLLAVVREFPSGAQNKIQATVYCANPSIEFAS